MTKIELTKYEKEAEEKWFKEHQMDCDGHLVGYNFRTGSGIGIGVEAECSCGATGDITDYETW